MVVPSLSHPDPYQHHDGHCAEANQAGYALQVISSFENVADERKQLASIGARALDGLVVYPRLHEASLEFYRPLAAQKPLVMVDRYVSG